MQMRLLRLAYYRARLKADLASPSQSHRLQIKSDFVVVTHCTSYVATTRNLPSGRGRVNAFRERLLLRGALEMVTGEVQGCDCAHALQLTLSSATTATVHVQRKVHSEMGNP